MVQGVPLVAKAESVWFSYLITILKGWRTQLSWLSNELLMSRSQYQGLGQCEWNKTWLHVILLLLTCDLWLYWLGSQNSGKQSFYGSAMNFTLVCITQPTKWRNKNKQYLPHTVAYQVVQCHNILKVGCLPNLDNGNTPPFSNHGTFICQAKAKQVRHLFLSIFSWCIF